MHRPTILLPIAFLFSVSSAFASIAVKSEYSYDQQGVVSFSGGDSIAGNINEKVTLPNAIYDFDIVSASSNIYELKSKARIDVNIDGRALNGFSGDGWFSTSAVAFSSSQLIDSGFVEGAPGQVGGFVEFLWDVTGASTITLDSKLQSDAFAVNSLYTTSFFNTIDENGIPELLLNDQKPPIGTRSVSSIQPGFFAPVTLVVDWLAGEELDFFFELQTSAVIAVQNLDAAGFNATLDSDFSNTAVLKEVRVYDQSMNFLPDAFVRGQDFIYDPAGTLVGSGGGTGGGTGGGSGGGGGINPNPVPEPNTLAIWLVLFVLGIGEARRRRICLFPG